MIYVVEDDKSIRELVAYAPAPRVMRRRATPLRQSFSRRSSHSGQAGAAGHHAPGEDGLAILRRLRETPETAAILS